MKEADHLYMGKQECAVREKRLYKKISRDK